MPFPSEAEVERLLALLPPPLSPLISLSPPVCIDLARLAAPHSIITTPIVPHPMIALTMCVLLQESELLKYEVGEILTAARPTRGHRADYEFIGTLDAETIRQEAVEVGFSIRDVWVDPTEAVEEIAPTTLEGVNARVTELAEVQEEDTQDLYAMIKDAQDRQTRLSQRVDVLIEDREFH
ncbi:hypothetical protein Tco_1050004 [Tanacetum coccineum]